MIAHHISRFSIVALFLLNLLGNLTVAQAATPYTGFYVGTMYITISGNVSAPERPIGPVAFTIKEDGTIVSSGDLTGTVDAAGSITWVTPNSGNFLTGTVAAGVISSTGSQTKDGTTTTFRASASNTAPGYSGNSPLSGRVEQVNPKLDTSNLTRVRYANGRFMAVGSRGTVAFSNDGLTWSRIGLSTTLSLFDIAFGNGMYVAVGDSGSVFTSPDGVTWTARSTGVASFTSVAFGNGLFMRCTFAGALSVSSDGITWQNATVTGGSGGGYSGLDFVNGFFASYKGSIVLTPDGVATAATGSANVGNIVLAIENAAKIAHGNGVYVVGGQQGVAYSPDGVTWTKGTGPSSRIDAVGFGNGLFIIQDAAKTMWTSTDGAQWSHHGQLASDIGSIAYNNGRFVGVGSSFLYTSRDGKVWFSPQEDALQPDVTVVHAVNQGGFAGITAYNASFSSTDPAVGPPQPGPIRGIYRPKNFDISNMYFGDAGYIWFYAGNPQFVQNAFGVAPKLTDKTLRAATKMGNNAVVIAGDGGVMIRVTQTNSLKGPAFELFPSVTSADLLSGTVDYANGWGHLFVGTGGTIVRNSQNGQSWGVVSSGVTDTLRFVQCFTSDEGLPSGAFFIAVGDNGTILTSPDGAGWIKRDSGTTARLIGVAYTTASNPGRYIAMAEDGSNVQSPDGITWTIAPRAPVAHRLTTFRNWQRVIVGGGENGEILQETTWTPPHALFNQSYASRNNVNAVALGNGRWVMVGGDSIGISLDGRNWNFQYGTPGLNGIVFAEGKFVAVGGSTIGISSDGVNWQFQNAGNNAQLEAVTYGNGRFVAVGASSAMFSDDGATWTAKVISGTSSLTGVTYGNGKFVTTGWSGTGAYSPDGETWTSAGTGGQTQQGVAFGNGRFASVGTDGRTTYSENGINWTSQRLNGPTTAESRPFFTRVIFVDGTFYAATLFGSLYTCTNAVDWKILHTGLSVDVYAMAAGNGLMILGGGHEIHTVVLPDSGSPAVTQHPTGANVLEGATVTLTGGFSGANLQYAWLKDGAVVVNGGHIAGADTATLTINGALPSDAGSYSLTAGNTQGSRATASAVVQVTGKPAILVQPTSMILEIGKNGSLTVQATGQNITYQWFRNGTAISGATTAALEISNATAAAAGVYYVELSNIAGVVTSAPASVSVRSALPGLALDPSWPAQPLSFAPNAYVGSGGLQPDGKLVINGFFLLNKPSGGQIMNFARLNADGTFDDSFAPIPPDSRIESYYFYPNGQFLVGGPFDKFDAFSSKGLAKINANGSVDTTYTPNLGPAYSGLVVLAPRADGKIIAGGAFSSWAGQNIRYLGLLDSAGLPDPSFVPSVFDNQVTAVTFLSDGSMIVGGPFTSPASRLARLSATGQFDATFNAGGAGIAPAAGFFVPAINKVLATSGDKVYVAGTFGLYNGQSVISLMRLNADGSLDATFNAGISPTFSPRVFDMHAIGDNLLIGGNLPSIQGNPTRTNLALIDSTGQLVDGLNLTAAPNGAVQRIIPDGQGNFIIVGLFTTVGGQPRPLLARLMAVASQSVPLAITSQPRAVQAETGETVIFSVAATGHGSLSFQWKRGSEVLAGQTSAVLTLANVTAAEAGTYSVVVTDATGSVTSDAVALTLGGGGGGGFSEWAATLPVGQRGAQDDPDQDGIPNIAEYVFGLNATVANSEARPTGISTQVGADVYPAVRFTRSTTATGATIQVNASSTITFATPETVVETVEPLGGGLERVTVRASVTEASLATFFFKVSVVQN